jgi:hypothetical protein
VRPFHIKNLITNNRKIKKKINLPISQQFILSTIVKQPIGSCESAVRLFDLPPHSRSVLVSNAGPGSARGRRPSPATWRSLLVRWRRRREKCRNHRPRLRNRSRSMRTAPRPGPCGICAPYPASDSRRLETTEKCLV